ncbi:MAG: ribosome biogenesis GTP-binding protein YihA/YsxC [Bdellovibrionota bacterium]
MPQDKITQPKKVQFLGGAARAAQVEQITKEDLPRVVLAGRSNVGKSSLLNALTKSKIARVSSEPGKTREINLFRWSVAYGSQGLCILADLPGYGYAKVAGSLKRQWGQEITKWLKSDPLIREVVVLVDGRHGFFPQDLELIEFLRSHEISYLVAFTKMDKWKSNNQRSNAEKDLARVSKTAGVERFVFVSSMASSGVQPLEAALRESFGLAGARAP